MREISEIIVHCTATRASQKVTVADVTRWHKQRGFATIGYHYLVDQAGNVFPGRPEATPGAHCLGHNAKSIGIAYCGGLDASGKPADTRTEPQKAALLGLLTELKQKYPSASIHGHRDFAQKACPCFDATNEYASHEYQCAEVSTDSSHRAAYSLVASKHGQAFFAKSEWL